MKLSIVIPCYNEEDNIPLLLEQFAKVIKKTDVEVILVDNGSTDRTSLVLEELLEKYPFAVTKYVPVNQGYGYGILQGLEIARGQYIGWTHADLQTDPADVMKVYESLERLQWPNHLFIKGNRKGRPLFDQFFTVGMSIFESVYMGEKLYDINAQPNIFPKSFFEEWKNPPYDFSLDLYALYMAQKKKLRILRFEVGFPERIHGSSKWNTGLVSKWKFIKRTVDFSRKLKKAGVE